MSPTEAIMRGDLKLMESGDDLPDDLNRYAQSLSEVPSGGVFNEAHYPPELTHMKASLMRQYLHYMGQIKQVYNTTQVDFAEKHRDWQKETYFFGPEDVIGHPEWENFYPALVVPDSHFSAISPQTEAPLADQRYVATELLSGNLSRRKRERLLAKAQGLVCSTNPQDENFFTRATLKECLAREGLTDNAIINEVLCRKSYTQVYEVDKRRALSIVWEEREEKGIRKFRFDRGEWEDETDAICRGFTACLISEVSKDPLNLGPGVSTAASSYLWASHLWASSRANESADLDPRDEDTWSGIRDFAECWRIADHDDLWADLQDGGSKVRDWVENLGAPILFGCEPTLQDITVEDMTKHRENTFNEFYWKGLHYELIRDTYRTRIVEALTDVQS